MCVNSTERVGINREKPVIPLERLRPSITIFYSRDQSLGVWTSMGNLHKVTSNIS